MMYNTMKYTCSLYKQSISKVYMHKVGLDDETVLLVLTLKHFVLIISSSYLECINLRIVNFSSNYKDTYNLLMMALRSKCPRHATVVLTQSKPFDYSKIIGNQYRPKFVLQSTSMSAHNAVEAHMQLCEISVYVLKSELNQLPYCLSTHTDILYTIYSLGEGDWSAWSREPCSRTCGGGTRNRSRNCTTPNHFDCCPGNNTDVERCGEISCPSEHWHPLFCAIQN